MITQYQKLQELVNNPNLIQFYAKRGCKKCDGRGYVTFCPLGGAPQRHLCQCVHKAVAKEVETVNHG